MKRSLNNLDLAVSTGRVVDFRAREYLRDKSSARTVPLIYPQNLKGGLVDWPVSKASKPVAIVQCDATDDLLVDAGYYVIVKRFSAKEERRRVVAAVYDPAHISTRRVGFENHLNYFHRNGRGLDRELAIGLAMFLNSSVIDSYFRQFSGHTQVNATDLRNFKYPSTAQLRRLGKQGSLWELTQDEIDDRVERLFKKPRLATA